MTIFLVGLLIALTLLGLPLFVTLGAGGLLATHYADLDPALLIVELNRLASSPYLAAIPLFTFAGVVLAAGGAPKRMIQLFNACVGWLPGGMAGVAIASCAFFTAFSGASGVTILALGGLMFPMLLHAGYGERFTLGLLTTSGSLGLLFAPSLAILLYGIVAGLGVGGIAIALAAQNSIEHFIGSLNLFADRPVRVGDLCRYGEDPTPDWQRIGFVESIGLRSTRIRGIDNTVTTIPNGDFSKMHLVNYSLRSRMLLLTVLGLRYETTDDQLRFVLASLRTMLLGHPRVVDDEPKVRFAGFGDYALSVEIRANINTTDPNEFRAIREDIFLRMMKIIKDAGTGIAFPSRTVYHTRDNGLDTERQQEAEAQVRAWCSAQELPFPTFTADYRKKIRNTLDYPPEGSPEASQ